MTDEDLKERLQYLHDQLEGASKLSTEERDRLSQVVKDVVHLVAHGKEKPAEPAEKEQKERVSKVRQKLEYYAAEFDAEHPRTSGVLRQIGAALERMGI